jgi:hypothetical protein
MKRRIAAAVALGLGFGVMPATAALADAGADSKPESSQASQVMPRAFANYDLAPGGQAAWWRRPIAGRSSDLEISVSGAFSTTRDRAGG